MKKTATDVKFVEPIPKSGETNSAETDEILYENGYEPTDNEIFHDLFEPLGRNKKSRRKY